MAGLRGPDPGRALHRPPLLTPAGSEPLGVRDEAVPEPGPPSGAGCAGRLPGTALNSGNLSPVTLGSPSSGVGSRAGRTNRRGGTTCRWSRCGSRSWGTYGCAGGTPYWASRGRRSARSWPCCWSELRGMPELPQRVFEKARQTQTDISVERRIFWLCPGRAVAKPKFGGATVEIVGGERSDLPGVARRVARADRGRPTGRARVSSSTLDRVATALKAAQFGVAIWSAAALDTPTIEMLCGMVDDLNATTRFSGLSLCPSDNAVGVPADLRLDDRTTDADRVRAPDFRSTILGSSTAAAW